MGFRFSIGNKSCGVTVNSRNGVSTRVSVPGTGISYTRKRDRTN
ncbi:MAG: DUF4236 domain-containing protein [Candidatus Heteroscillospira sp.]